MSRYRPPSPTSSPYITTDGAAQLRKELQQLWKVERPVVTATVQEAAKNGDRSENGDYIYGKRRLREIDNRVRYLTTRLENISIVDQAPADRNRVYFGAWTTVISNTGEQSTYRIVGSDEIDPARGYISVDSPMARALLGKVCGQDVEFEHMEQHHCYRLVAISYQSAAPISSLTSSR